jgi:DNA-binding CsgD family transcriptional regulator
MALSKEDRAIQWLIKGKRASWTANQLGVHPTTVQRWAAKHGIKLEYPYIRAQDRTDLIDKKEILRLRKLRMVYTSERGRPVDRHMFAYPEIAEMMGCSASYVKQVCMEARQNGLL